MTTNSALVEAFIAAWNAGDGPAIIAAFAPDAVYHNVPMAPLVGVAAIAAAIEGLIGGMSDIRWELHAIAEDGAGRVLTERTDAFRMAGAPVALPVMGIFEFRDGLITRWSDYFDLATYQAQLAAGAEAQ
ncbi:MAG: nuclear transport factor 2 family protein [Sphingomonadales bacterium]|nr:nuclear transport factor 2 family protein [Sphingomonadales bacterium]